MTIFSYILVAFLIVCAVAVCLNKNLLTSIVIFMSYSVIMCIIWILLESPDQQLGQTLDGLWNGVKQRGTGNKGNLPSGTDFDHIPQLCVLFSDPG